MQRTSEPGHTRGNALLWGRFVTLQTHFYPENSDLRDLFLSFTDTTLNQVRTLVRDEQQPPTEAHLSGKEQTQRSVTEQCKPPRIKREIGNKTRADSQW